MSVPIDNNLSVKAAQSAQAVEYTDSISADGEDLLPPRLNKYTGYNTGALGNTEHPIIAIAPRSSLTRSGSTW